MSEFDENRAYEKGWDDAMRQDKIAFKSLDKEIATLLDALIWCSAASDFQEGGIAREGFIRLVRPLIQPNKSSRHLSDKAEVIDGCQCKICQMHREHKPLLDRET